MYELKLKLYNYQELPQCMYIYDVRIYISHDVYIYIYIYIDR